MKSIVNFFKSIIVIELICLNVFGQVDNKKNVAVLNFENRGSLLSHEVKTLTDRLRSLLVRSNAFNVVDRDKMEEILYEQGFQQTGCTSAECAVEIGQILNVEQIVTGSVGKLGTLFTVDIILVDVATSRILLSLFYDHKGDIESLIQLMETIALELSSMSKEIIQENNTGSLNIKTIPTSSTIFLDEKEVGLSPLHLNGLVIGEHKVRIEKSGYSTLFKNISILKNQISKYEIQLKRFYQININSNPSDAFVFINNESIGKTPLIQEINENEKINIKLKMENYYNWEKDIIVKDDTEINAVLNKISKLFTRYKNSIQGKIIGENDNAVSEANVFIKGLVLGSASDKEGFFQIKNIPSGKFVISITVVGFKEKNIELDIKENSNIDLGEIQLVSFPLISSPIIVTASRHKQSIREVPVSVSTIDKSEIELRNNISIDQALQYVPGISMNQDQINIRGSSGYSRGVGSRVMMLVDGVPYITGDTQGTVPEALAINQVENIEIVKGASSALYGSSAIGGVINIITKSIDENPVFNLKLYGGLYDEPYYDQWKWSSGSKFQHGIKADYSQKLDNTGFRIAVAQDRDDSFRKNDWSNRINLGGKLEHEFSAFEKISISGNYMDQKRGNFLYWESLDNALVPPASQLDDKVHSTRLFISPAYRKIVSDSNYFNINAIWFHNYFDDNIDAGNQSTSDNLNLSFQYNISFSKHFLTFGLSTEYNTVSSNIFGTRQGLGAGLYVQDEIRWTRQWFTTFGARLDYFDIDKLGSDISVNPKIGVVFQSNSLTTFRTSFGTGFRAPSMAEAFTSTVASGITVIPNENLKPEKSYTAEFGWNQIISNFINTDIAIFYSRYFDLIESGFTPDFKAQFNNVTDAEISGIDFSLHFNLFNKSVISKTGYTFIEPRNITLNKSEYLKYRPRHLLYTNVFWKYKNLTVGMDYRYISKYDKIDEEFARLIADGDERIAVNVVDIQISQMFKLGNFPLQVSFQVNNILQYNYIDLIGSIASIRNFIFAFDITL